MVTGAGIGPKAGLSPPRILPGPQAVGGGPREVILPDLRHEGPARWAPPPEFPMQVVYDTRHKDIPLRKSGNSGPRQKESS
jgi:hypothetical protein